MAIPLVLALWAHLVTAKYSLKNCVLNFWCKISSIELKSDFSRNGGMSS